MSKLERLLNLTAVLLDSRQPMTAEAIASRVPGYPEPGPSFRRSFERDKEDLRVMGVPLRVERVPGTDPPVDGYRIPPEDYYLPDPGLDAEELAALHLASMTVRTDGLGDDEGLWKLGGAVEPRPETEAVASLPHNPHLAAVFGAITDRIRIGFDYRDQRREVEPWRLDFQRGRWYLSGFDLGRDGERNYRLDRIESSVELISEPGAFTRADTARDGRVRQGWELGENPPVDVELLVDAERVAQARQAVGTAVAEASHSSGGVVFTVPVVNEDAFRSFVLGFLEYAEVLGPPEVRSRLLEWLDALIEAP